MVSRSHRTMQLRFFKLGTVLTYAFKAIVSSIGWKFEIPIIVTIVTNSTLMVHVRTHLWNEPYGEWALTRICVKHVFTLWIRNVPFECDNSRTAYYVRSVVSRSTLTWENHWQFISLYFNFFLKYQIFSQEALQEHPSNHRENTTCMNLHFDTLVDVARIRHDYAGLHIVMYIITFDAVEGPSRWDLRITEEGRIESVSKQFKVRFHFFFSRP